MKESLDSHLEPGIEHRERAPGHPALHLERREDGRLYLPDGTEVTPNIPVGPEPHHLRLFVGYERTFGRGLVKYVTHSEEEERPVMVQKYGEGFLDEYHELANEYGRLTTGKSEELEAFIVRLEGYRARHPQLYADVLPAVEEGE